MHVVSALLLKSIMQTQSRPAERELQPQLFSSDSFDVPVSLDQSVPGGVSACAWECSAVTCRARMFLKSRKHFI